MLFSWLSLTLVENPIRRRKVLPTRSSIFAATGTAMAALATFGLAVHFGNGFKTRIPEEALQIADGGRDWARGWADCDERSSEDVKAGRLCRLGNDGSKGVDPHFLLWGDSHALVLFPAIDQVAKEFGTAGFVASHRSCPPAATLMDDQNASAMGCRSFNDSVHDLISDQHLGVVFLAARWNAYLQDDGSRPTTGSEDDAPPSDIFEGQLREMIEQLHARGTVVFFVEEVPYPNNYNPSRFARAVWKGADPSSAGISMTDYLKRNEHVFRYLESLSVLDLKRVSTSLELCRDGVFCAAVSDRRSNYADANHLSTHGAEKLVPAFRKAFAQIDWN
jgi:SGNH domain (fused to AT3 domains)